MWIRTLILLTLAISAFGYVAINEEGESIDDKIQDELNLDGKNSDCQNMKAEIMFIIDASRSIYVKHFYKQIAFLKSFVDYFTIGNDAVRFGAVTFGKWVIKDNSFGLTEYTNKDQLKEALSQIDYRIGEEVSRTQTHLALQHARETMFRDTRPSVKKIAIVITDGQSSETKKTRKEALEMRNDEIVILAIGVGPNVSHEELFAITGRNDYIFRVGKYEQLKEIRDTLREITCRPADEGCSGKIDINFVFDSSKMFYDDTDIVNEFIVKSIESENFAEGNLRYGMITGKCRGMKGFYLNTYQSKADIQKHFDDFYQISITSLLGKNLTEYFTYQYGGRKGARKVAVIFLKGKLSDPNKMQTIMGVVHESGIEVFVIKMDEMNSDETLSGLTKYDILDATSNSALQLSGEFLYRLCKQYKPGSSPKQKTME